MIFFNHNDLRSDIVFSCDTLRDTWGKDLFNKSVTKDPTGSVYQAMWIIHCLRCACMQSTWLRFIHY